MSNGLKKKQYALGVSQLLYENTDLVRLRSKHADLVVARALCEIFTLRDHAIRVSSVQSVRGLARPLHVGLQ